MHHWNELLPEVERQHIDRDETTARTQLKRTVHQIQQAVTANAATTGLYVSNKDLGRFFRQIYAFEHLKYKCEVDLTVQMLHLLMQLCLAGKRLSVPMLLKAFMALKMLCKKHKDNPAVLEEFCFNWRPIWDEIMAITSRGRRHEATCSEHLLSDLLTLLVEFLHSSRVFIAEHSLPANVVSAARRDCIVRDSSTSTTTTTTTTTGVKQDNSIEALVEEAMAKLADVRYPTCAEGVLMLLTCLPTTYTGYKELLPRWIEHWVGFSVGDGGGDLTGTAAAAAAGTATRRPGGMDHNTQWDYAWLALLSRARKYVRVEDFDWQALLPLLLTKTRELLGVPATPAGAVDGVKGSQNTQFPRCFPPYLARLLLIQNGLGPPSDARTMALKKCAKLLHFVTSQHPPQGQLVPALLPLGITPPSAAATGLAAANATAAASSSTCVLLLSSSSSSSPPSPAGSAVVSNNAAAAVPMVLPGANAVMTFIQSLRPYFNPANSGSWTASLATLYLTYVLQLCRHVGHELATCIARSAPISKKYLPRLHIPTVQYLVTNLLPFCLEGLYSKHPHMSQYCSACLKNLVAVQPEVSAPIVVPFLLAALDPAAVAQAHQAPVAMKTLSTCFRSLMYPQPILLPYLPDILRLSLPGIQPSDVAKTSITLHLYSTIFAWLPATLTHPSSGSPGSQHSGGGGGEDRALKPLPSYLEVVRGFQVEESVRDVTTTTGTASTSVSSSSYSSSSSSADLSVAEVSTQLEQLTEYISTEWCGAVLDKLFAVLEAQEQAVEGAKASPLAGALGQCATYLFQSLRPLPSNSCTQTAQDLQSQLRREMQQKVRNYFVTSTPLNAAKASAKLVEAMVTADPIMLSGIVSDLLLPSAAAGHQQTQQQPQQQESQLPISVPVVLELPQMLLNTYSYEKVAFRLRLVGGACRGASAANIAPLVDPVLKPLLTSPLLYNHEEKLVREATGKLLKDVLKGATSIYPNNLEPVYAVPKPQLVGYPNMTCVDNISWHVPDPAVLGPVIELLRAVVTDGISEMQNITSEWAAQADAARTSVAALATGATAAGGAVTAVGSNSTSSSKKKEELIVNRLGMLEKALRGAAEILGDVDLSASGGIGAGTGVDATEALLSTGREDLLRSLSQSSSGDYLRQLRVDVLRFLVQLQNTLTSGATAAGGGGGGGGGGENGSASEEEREGQQQEGSMVATGSSSSSAATSAVSINPLVSLRNNIGLQKLWIGLFCLVVSRRMACIKDVENVRKYMKYSVKTGRSSVTNVVYHRMKYDLLVSSPSSTSTASPPSSAVLQPMPLRDINYWRFHDSSTSGIACMAWIQHVRRARALAMDAMRTCCGGGGGSGEEEEEEEEEELGGEHDEGGSAVDPFMQCLNLLVTGLCTHEYDSIRRIALKGFETASARFGFKLVNTVRCLLKTLCNSPSAIPGAGVSTAALNYHSVSGALHVLAQSRMQKRILGDARLLESFLRTMLLDSTPVVLAATEEPDKRERLMKLVVEALLKYVKKWYADPSLEGTAARKGETTGPALLRLALQTVGYAAEEEEEVVANASGAEVSGGAGAGAASKQASVGLRLETFASFLVLHLIGRPIGDKQSSSLSADESVSVWQWALDTMCNVQQRGQPSQSIALAALTRLSWITSQKLSSATPITSSSSSSARHQYLELARSVLSPASPTCGLRELFTGASQSHPKVSEDGSRAQWGRGIEQVISATHFLKAVVPRRLSSGLKSDRNQYSSSFRREDAAMYMNLALIGLFGTATNDLGNGTFTVSHLTALFACTADLPTANEGEKRSNNTVKAELFAGVLRAWRRERTQHATAAARAAAGGAGTGEVAAVEQFFVEVLQDAVEKGSLEYCRDWQEAVCFAYAEAPSQVPAAGAVASSCSTDAAADALVMYMLGKFEEVISKAGDASAVGNLEQQQQQRNASEQQSSESFAAQAKFLQLTCALLQADQEACFLAANGENKSSVSGAADTSSSAVGRHMMQLLLRQEVLVSPYRSTRLEFAYLVGMLSENCPTGQIPEVILLCKKLAAAATAAAANAVLDGDEAKSSTNQSLPPPPPPPPASIADTPHNTAVQEDKEGEESVAQWALTPQAQLHKNAAETVCILLQYAVHRVPVWRLHTAWVPLFEVALLGAGNMASVALEAARMCHDSCLLVANASLRQPIEGGAGAGEHEEDLVAELLLVIDKYSKDSNTPLHSRETLMQCLSLLMGNNWNVFFTNEKKMCKDILSKGIDDVKPEVQQLAQAGMVSYLSYKTVAELSSIAAVYAKNSDILAAREKKNRKQQRSSNSAGVAEAATTSKVDAKHQNTILMMSCLVVATPYDLPAYLPALLASFVWHVSVPALRDTVSRTVQLFKRTHQDRWDEYKDMFTSDQLDELQGTGAAHYYS